MKPYLKVKSITLDLKIMYTNILLEEGIESFKEVLDKLYIWSFPPFPPGEGLEYLVLENFRKLVYLVLPTIPTWGGFKIFGSGIF